MKRLRTTARGRAAKIVSFSASTFNFQREQAIALGCDDHLAKPFREIDLLTILERRLRVEWIRASSEQPESKAGEAGARPTPQQTTALLAFARRGDVAGLREALRELKHDHPVLAAFAEEIDAIAARYRMQEIRQRLDEIAGSPRN